MTYHYDSIDEIRQTNRNAGYHFFDAEALRFFNSRILEKVYEGQYFVTSEKGPDGMRRYSVRRADESGRIDTMGAFQEHDTPVAAVNAITDHSWEDEG